METIENPDTTPIVINDTDTEKVTNHEIPPSEPEPNSIADNTTEIETLNKQNQNKQNNDVNNYSNIASINNNENVVENVVENVIENNIVPSVEPNENNSTLENGGNDIIPSDINDTNNINGHNNDIINNDIINNDIINNDIINNDESNDSVQIIDYKPPTITKHENDSKNAQEDAIDNHGNNNVVHLEQIENNSKSDATNTNNIETNHVNNNNNNIIPNIDDNQMDIDNESKTDNNINNENNEIQTENNNDFGIGTEHNNNNTNINNNNNTNNDKEEMDIDDEPVHELTVTRKKKPNKNSTNNPINPKVQTSTLGTENKPFGMDDYDEELDEDFNEEEEEEEEEEEDDGSSHSVDVIDDGEDDSNTYSDLDDIDIVDDKKLYTEDAPRWLDNIDEVSYHNNNEWDCEYWYEEWEKDKLNDNNEDNFFQNLIKKYNKKDKCDPEKDKIKRDNYKLDDNFINDEDCFDDMGGHTQYDGFHITVKHPNVKRMSPKVNKYSKKKKPQSAKFIRKVEIPQTYKNEINKINEYVQQNKDSMDYIINHREMNGIVNNKQKYMKHMVLSEDKKDENDNDNDNEMVDKRIVNVYKKLLMMILELDTMLLREKSNNNISEQVKSSIYHELAIICGYDPNVSSKKQKNTFEDLLNWYSYDWYDCEHEIQSKKINWRSLFLSVIKNRAKARFHVKMNKKRPTAGIDNKKEKLASKFENSDIPWDGIANDIFRMDCYSMEAAAINDTDIDDALEQQHVSLKDSISKYLVNGVQGITVEDIEQYYQAQKNQPFPTSHCYSYLITQRIKEGLRVNKKNKKSPKKHKKSKDKSVVDLTNNHNKKSNTNIPSPPPLISDDIDDVITQTQEINIKPQTELQSPLPGGFFRPNNNGVIDLTDDVTVSNTVTANNTIHNTPTQTVKNSRKRRWHDVSPNTMTTQNNDFNAPPNKKTKLTHNNPIMYQPFEDAMQPGSLIVIQHTNDIQNGVSIVVVEGTDHTHVWYKDYKTKESGRCEYNLCYRIVPYVEKRYSNNIQMDNILALVPLSETEFDTKYAVAKVTKPPNSMINNNVNNNDMYYEDNCTIVVRYNDREREIPLFTFIQSEQYDKWSSNKIPTVIKIVPFMSDNSRQFGGKAKMNSNGNSNGNNNNNNDVIIINEPPLSHIFIRTLPDDPWNDQHFAGGGN